MPPPALTVAHISIAFTQRTKIIEVVRDISFNVRDGEFVALLGPSGCGKTTLLNAVSGLIKPPVGTIKVFGDCVEQPGDHRMAYMFQSDVLVPWKTARENVALPLMITGKKDRGAFVDEYLALVGLGGFGDTFPAQLSGGMRQRVQLARTLIQEPRILLMDEPFGALDAQTRRQLQEDFLRICHNRSITVLLVTHDVQEAVLMADRILILTDRPGRIHSEVLVPFERPREMKAVIAHEDYDVILLTVLSALESISDSK